MPRKPRNELLAVLLCQAALVVQVLLQVSEGSLNFVVRVRHSLAVLPLVGKEVWQVEVQAVHRCLSCWWSFLPWGKSSAFPSRRLPMVVFWMAVT